MMHTIIRPIDHAKQRYPTVGDYWLDSRTKVLEIRVSQMHCFRYEFLVSVHEFIEAGLCLQRGIPFQAIDAFDKAFKGEGEPGDDRNAPYRREHRFATRIERLLARELGVSWPDYEQTIERLFA